MALQTTASSGLSAEMKTFYDRTLLERTVPKLIHAQFGQEKTIPARGGKVIEFRKFTALAVATTPLTEGALFTNLGDLTVTTITATVAQYGNAIGFSDIVSTTTIDPILTETTELLGEQAGESIDELVRDTLVAGTTVLYVTPRVSRVTIVAADIITVADVRKIALQLTLNRARKINGFWQCITHPRVTFDLQATAEWVTANQFHQTGNQFDGSLGTLYGVKFWETDKAKVYVDGGSGSVVDVYVSLIFGQNAFGVVKLAGQNLQTIYKPLGSAGTADALNQQSTMGWKATFGTKILQEAFMLRYECSTSTGANT